MVFEFYCNFDKLWFVLQFHLSNLSTNCQVQKSKTMKMIQTWTFFFICKKMALPLIATTLFGCCSAVICLELLIQEDSGVGHLVTFCAFLFISADGLLNELQLGRKKLQVPGKIGNFQFNYCVSMFRSFIEPPTYLRK